MTSAWPHPTSPSGAPLRERARIENRRSTDPAWHFQLDLPAPVEVEFEGLTPPGMASPASLGLYRLERPEARVEVLGFVPPREVDPADLLVELLVRQGMAIVSEQRVADPAGARGDVLARWTVDGREQAGRFYASKWGSRMFLLCMTSAAADYPALAETFLATIASLRALGDAPGPFAEETVQLGGARPAHWKATIPASWEVELLKSDAKSGFHALQIPFDPSEGQYGGALSFSVFPRAGAANPRAAANVYLDTLRRTETLLESDHFEEEPARPPFKKSWLLVTGIARPDGEARCRVLQNDRAWVVIGVWGPTRARGPMAWMQNKRTLDLVAGAVEA